MQKMGSPISQSSASTERWRFPNARIALGLGVSVVKSGILRTSGIVVAETEGSHIRLDKWLWVARFFKTRSLAAAAITGGKVKANGERVKAARAVRLDDELSIHVGPYEYVVRVRGLSGRRGPAPEAALLYAESAQSKAAREALAARLSAERIYVSHEKGRPTKRARRQIIRFKKARVE
jgi:ribosome-associated heat shock protein Hsp15